MQQKNLGKPSPDDMEAVNLPPVKDGDVEVRLFPNSCSPISASRPHAGIWVLCRARRCVVCACCFSN